MAGAFLLEKMHLIAVFSEEGILHILSLLGFQHFLSLVPIEFGEAGVHGLCRAASVA